MYFRRMLWFNASFIILGHVLIAGSNVQASQQTCVLSRDNSAKDKCTSLSLSALRRRPLELVDQRQIISDAVKGIGKYYNIDDFDECLDSLDVCGPYAVNCTNTVGSYVCLCQYGYINNNGPCEDIDECLESAYVCGPHADNCTNSLGSYVCSCQSGYVNISGPCEDVDECLGSADICGPNAANCTNTLGSYVCLCQFGYVNINGSCDDIDECSEPADACGTGAVNCTNTIGSYVCACQPGYSNKTGPCKDVDECQEGIATCSNKAECINTVGTFECSCLNGYEGYPISNGNEICIDMDECNRNLDNCNSNAQCTNVDGSFDCTCNSGYSGDGTTSCVDTEAPVFVRCPSDTSVKLPFSWYSEIPSVAATDNSGGDYWVFCNPRTSDHDAFPVGESTNVTCEAGDGGGNKAWCSYVVTVIA